MTAVDTAVRGLYRSEYVRLAELGSFDDERVELIKGEIVTMSPVGKNHMQVVARITRLLSRQLPGDGWLLSVQSSFAAALKSQPEPDFSVVRDNTWELPSAAALIVEVMDSSRRMDLKIKPEIYGAAGVPVYAVVDLRDRVLHVHTEPSADGYARLEILKPGEPLRVAEPPLVFDIAEVLPPV